MFSCVHKISPADSAYTHPPHVHYTTPFCIVLFLVCRVHFVGPIACRLLAFSLFAPSASLFGKTGRYVALVMSLLF